MRVLAREVFIIILLVIAFLCINLYEYFLVEGYEIGVSLQSAIVLLECYLAYFSIELIVFYKYSYHLAQNTMLLAIIIVFCASYACKMFGYSIDLESISFVCEFLGMMLIDVTLFVVATVMERKS